MVGEETLSESECLSRKGILIVLAEPGAGKTELLNNFSKRLSVKNIRANIFRYSNNINASQELIIDALDEVAKIGQAAVDEIIVKAIESDAETVILASRSSEWNQERNAFIRDCTGEDPTVVHLTPFDQKEQKALFDGHFPTEDFKAFQQEAKRFELIPILGNPMFFRLLVEGYIQGDRRFNSKHQIIKDAIERLASDKGKTALSSNRAPTADIIRVASEVFAKLLLSGVTGVATVERQGNLDFPYLLSVCTDSVELRSAINSRLFKPASDIDLHEPVHRMVAEYCAAHYLTQRMEDPTNRLTIRRCLAVIAPNSIVRDELRGLVGWLAAMGRQTLQETIIEIDPYAVLANGDPAQLTSRSKKLLLNRLRDLAKVDPYFRRSDIWRQFNVSGFFTEDIAETVRTILQSPSDASQLLNLILELLRGSEAANKLIDDLRAIMLDTQNNLTGRLLARRCLASSEDYEFVPDFQSLISEGTLDALKVAAEFASDRSPQPIERRLLLHLLRSIAKPSPKLSKRRSRYDDSRIYIKQLINSINFENTVWLLDNLTENLSCTCGAKRSHQCECRTKASKVVGQLLDRYFKLAPGASDPKNIWNWTKNLQFDRAAAAKESFAVDKLQEDSYLRQSVQILAFEELSDSDKIRDLTWQLRSGEIHQGLCFKYEDWIAIVDYAFDTDNVTLWCNFLWGHNKYNDPKEPDLLRARMRHQARKKPEFMSEWAKRHHKYRSIAKQDRKYLNRRRRYERQDKAALEKHFSALRANRELIEQGGLWKWNWEFAYHYLYSPDDMHEVVDDVKTAERALSNCLTSLTTPCLQDLAQGIKGRIATVLYAACLVRFRKQGNLANIDQSILRAVKTTSGNASCCGDDEVEQFESELDARIFCSTDDIEVFAREYVEPTLMNPKEQSNNLYWFLGNVTDKTLASKLALEWLNQYKTASVNVIDKLFDTYARYGDRSLLVALVVKRCNELLTPLQPDDDAEYYSLRNFWFLRHFYFADSGPSHIWNTVLSEPKGIFALERRSGRFYRGDTPGWPKLGAEKIFRILDAYISVWPKVFLPSSWGTGDPEEEQAYRFLTEVIWGIGQAPPDLSIPVIDNMLSDCRFSDFYNDLRSMRASAIKTQGLIHFTTPALSDVANLLDAGVLVSVEDMRALLIEEFEGLQRWLKGAETDPLEVFWPNGKRVDENTARNRIVEKLQDRMNALNACVVIEHHMADSNRCDITASSVIDGNKALLVCEVKGQWHRELYTAAANQLVERYSIHPDAAYQGVYLALWFGTQEKVAGKSRHFIKDANQLRQTILDQMPMALYGLIDVFVLDLSKQSTPVTTPV